MRRIFTLILIVGTMIMSSLVNAQDSLLTAPRQVLIDSAAVYDSILTANLRKVPALIDKNQQNKSLDSFVVVKNKEFYDYIRLKKQMPNISSAVATDPVERKFKDQEGILILLFLFLLFVVISYFFSRDLNSMIQGLINNRILNQLVRDNNLLNSESFIFIALLIGFTFSYLIKVLFNIQYVLGTHGIVAYLILSAFVIVFFLAKTIILKLGGLVFSIKQMVNNYISIIYISFGSFTLILIPLLILNALGPVGFQSKMPLVFIFVLISSFAYQYLRGAFFISSNFQFSKFYFIIYLCAFEICPLIILYKVLLR